MRIQLFRPKTFPTALLAVLLLAGALRHAAAGDWPQILGPNRNGRADDEKLAAKWPADGPPVVWQRAVGSGMAGVAAADGVLVLFHRVGGAERVEAMDSKTGRVLWESDSPATYVPSYTSDNGPRAVPLIHKEHVYVYGAMGRLRCLSLEDGKAAWERDTYDDFNSKRPQGGEPPEGYFGLGSSPIVEGEKLLLNVGGAAQGAGVVAFALKDGKTVWKSTEARASYSSPVAADIAGVRQVIFAARFQVLSLDPENGEVRWRFPFGRPGPNVTAANPLVIGENVFVSASYGFGAVWAKAGKDDVEIIWQGDDVLSSQYTTGIVLEQKHGGPAIVGIHGRQDLGTAALRCIDPAAPNGNGKILWEQPEFGYATLIAADGKLLILKTDGELILAEASAEKYEELARAAVLDGTARALPALSGGLLYVRDENTLKCIDLRERRD